MANKISQKSNLILGWKVDNNWEPIYWKTDSPKPGNQDDSDLVTIDPKMIGFHTAIIAQSGSGKSFLLGRLIEEIALRTQSNCIIFDPNADFIKIYEIEKIGLWKDAIFANGRGKLPHEKSQVEFKNNWNLKSKSIYNLSMNIQSSVNLKRLSIIWETVDSDFISEELDPILRSPVFHCHNFLKALIDLFKIKYYDLPNPPTLQKVNVMAQYILTNLENNTNNSFNLNSYLKLQFDTQKLISKIPLKDLVVDIKNRIADNKRLIRTAVKSITPAARISYFGKLEEYIYNRIIETNIFESSSILQDKRIQVIDLPSLNNKSTKLLTINSILQEIWTKAKSEWNFALQHSPEDDKRVPTFIIIDEAHNLIPSNPKSISEKTLLEQFRTIVAEGRKYGIFLIVASQRPDKLDPMILSDCENKIIMKLSSKSVLEQLSKVINLEDIPVRILNKCLELTSGKGILIGNWAENSYIPFYSAARRTVEGGRNLRPEYWAKP